MHLPNGGYRCHGNDDSGANTVPVSPAAAPMTNVAPRFLQEMRPRYFPTLQTSSCTVPACPRHVQRRPFRWLGCGIAAIRLCRKLVICRGHAKEVFQKQAGGRFVFDEDCSRARKDNVPLNLAVLRRIALNIVRSNRENARSGAKSNGPDGTTASLRLCWPKPCRARTAA
jgi:hypothetical protein